MSDKELHEYALELANNTLKRVFDSEAYICKCLAEKRLNELNTNDKVPNSNIDELIDDIAELFITYMNNRSDDNLKRMISYVRQMLSELYNTCDTEQRELFGNEIKLFTNIVN